MFTFFACCKLGSVACIPYDVNNDWVEWEDVVMYLLVICVV